MPMYEYECSNCNHKFEAEQNIKDKPLKKCPSCKKNKLERLISQTAFTLKGGGWAKDLYSLKK
jgi:putative FmdB family regulatory protein